MRVSQLRFIVGLAFVLGAMAAWAVFHHASPGTILLVALVYLSTLMVTIAILLDYPRLPRRPRPSDLASELHRKNLLSATRYCADRAFRVEALHKQGPHYFLQLESGDVLHLCGPYLYDYEPGEGAVRHFPCTQFTVRRHAQTGQVVDIVCEGLVIEPEIEAPPYNPRDVAQGLVPADGEILRNVSFDQLRQQRVGSPIAYREQRM